MDQIPQQPNQQQPGDGLEDMFAETDALQTPPPAAPVQQQPLNQPTGREPFTPPAAPQVQEDARTPEGRRVGRGSKVRLIVLGVAALVFLAVVAFAYGPRLFDGDDAEVAETNLNNVTPVVEDPEPERPDVSSAGTEFVILDSDGDGLTDEREDELGTKPGEPDSDLDGLSDREEVEIYKTNPLDRDSDDDTFSDGEEVRNFFNPNGEGPLIKVKDEIESFEESQENQ